MNPRCEGLIPGCLCSGFGIGMAPCKGVGGMHPGDSSGNVIPARVKRINFVLLG